MFSRDPRPCIVRGMNENRQPRRRRQRPHRNVEQRKGFVELWLGSGQSVEDFCVANDISPGTFTHWLAEFSDGSRGSDSMTAYPAEACSTPGSFVELRLDVTDREERAFRRQSDLVVRGRGGVEVELYGPAAQLVLERVMEMMKGGTPC